MEYLLTAPWSVSQLIDNFYEGRIAIPEIQRDLVWSSDQVKSLLDSIYQSYPCGSLILWEPRDHDAKLMREIIRPERLEYYQGKLPRYFLIDGQQRVTALASVMLKPGFLKEVEPEIENDFGSLYVNLRKFPKEIEGGWRILSHSSFHHQHRSARRNITPELATSSIEQGWVPHLFALFAKGATPCAKRPQR